jgi:hypothetical protein
VRWSSVASTTSVVVLCLAASGAGAQMPGLPVLQNAFANPGITVGLNYGRAESLTGVGAAAAWAPGNARFALSAGFGTAKPDGDEERSNSYGARVSVPVLRLMSDAVGLGAFGGFGGASQAKWNVIVAGVSAGYRRPIGKLGVSLHAAPSWQRASIDVAGTSVSASVIRFSAGADVSFGGRYGATIGVETGGSPKADEPGSRGTVFGLGFSYALRRVR